MKIDRIVFLFITTLFFFSCFSDKGNYDYKKYDELWAAFPQSVYRVAFGESIEIIPDVRYSDEKITEEPDLNYEWSIDDVVLSTDKTFKFTAGDKVDEKELYLRIEDKKNSAKYGASCSIWIESAYKTGFMILHEDESGNSDISLIRTSKGIGFSLDEEGRFNDTLFFRGEYKNLYTLVNGASMGKNVVSITEHSTLHDHNNSVHTEITVISENGARMEDLNGFSFAKETSIQDEFPDGMPENFKTKKVLHACWDSYLIGADNKMFTRRNALSDAYHTSVYKKNNTYNGDTKYDDVFFTDYSNSGILLALEYDKSNQRNFIGITCALFDGDEDNGARMPILPLKGSEGLMSEVENLKGDFLFSDYCVTPFVNDGVLGQYFIVNENGTYYLRYYEFESVGNNKNLVLYGASKIDLTSITGGKKILGMVSCKAETYTEVYNIVYFLDGEKVYAYTFNKDQSKNTCTVIFDGKGRKIAAFDAYTNIRNFQQSTSYDALLAVAYEDGEVEVYEMVRANLLEVNDKPLFKSENKYGKIKQIVYKYGDAAGFFKL